ncbi:hypothetical protein DV737_g5574, partial [Chaetothyriales sp. CBS 132003]
MSEPEIGTKAPESDATDVPQNEEASGQSGPAVGEHCTSDRPLLSADIQPSGTIGKLGDIDTYISKPPSYPSVPAPLLLLLTGGTGIYSPNNQHQADKYASCGFVVIMPDQFGSDPAPATNTTPSLLDSIKLKAAETAKSFLIDMWLARQTREKVLPRLHRVLEAARDEYADCLAHSGGGIYAAGYCFGAKYVLILAGERQLETGSKGKGKGNKDTVPVPFPPLKAGAVAHGTLVTREDVKGIKAPVSVVAVENDPLFPEEILDIGRKHLASSGISHEVRVYAGVPHGFAVVGDYADAHIQAEQEKAFAQMLGWLKSH